MRLHPVHVNLPLILLDHTARTEIRNVDYNMDTLSKVV